MSCTLVYLSLSGMAPAYLTADGQLVSDEGRRQLRSPNSMTLDGPTAAMETGVLRLSARNCEQPSSSFATISLSGCYILLELAVHCE